MLLVPVIVVAVILPVVMPIGCHANPLDKRDVEVEEPEMANLSKRVAVDSDVLSFLSSMYEDQECPEGQYWHIRGEQCVPIKCRGGNRWRDDKTGRCIRKSNRRYNFNPIYYFVRGSLRRLNTPHRFYWG